MILQNGTKLKALHDISLPNVTITEQYRVNAMAKEIDYLKDFSADRLLAGFFETSGLTPKAEKYPGWESTEIRGHTMGHFLSAMAQAYANTHDKEIKATLEYIITQLKLCQQKSGYLCAFEENLFDKIEQKIPAWVPWYTMHKIISGLVSVFKFTGNLEALDVVSHLGEWVYTRTKRWDESMKQRVLAVEYGGMNDCMYELYKLTHNENHLIAAHKFDEISLLEPTAQGKDVLNGRHANTTIPKFLGALNRFCILGESEKMYLFAAMNFWDIVTTHHSYITGGNSEWEHFGEPDVLDGERSNCNCETCNTYNMLRLSSELFKLTGDSKYADFYENTSINAILSSQNPDTGMTTYFQPMATGYFKVYSTPFDKFWCCTGTGMENFTKLNEGLCYFDGNTIYINQYISSIISFENAKVKLIINVTTDEFQKVSIKVKTKQDETKFVLKLRLPDWLAGKPEIRLGKEIPEYRVTENYFIISRDWKNADEVELRFPMGVIAQCLPDNHHVVAFKYGPYVLSAGLGMADLETSSTGVMVTIPSKNMPVKDFITINKGEIFEWIQNITHNMVKTPGKLEFTLKRTDSDDLVFTPHFAQHKERYGMYWNLVKPNSAELKQLLLQTAQKQQLEKSTIDMLPVGNDQYELEHEVKGEYTLVDTFDNHRFRSMQKDGWFSYKMKVDTSHENLLMLNYHSKLHGGTVVIYVNDTVIYEEMVKPIEPFGIYSKTYPIPVSLTTGENLVTIKFVAKDEKGFGGLFNTIRILRSIV